jgi:hypothetical protein
MPVVDGRKPVIIAVRDGLQTVDGLWALVKVIPIRPRRSKLGVCAFSEYPPKELIQSFMSSRAMNRTLGLRSDAISLRENTNVMLSVDNLRKSRLFI